MDQLDDIFADGTVKKARPTGKFQPKAKPKPPKKNSAAASVPSSTVVQTSEGAVPPSEALPVDVPNTENIGLASDIPLKDSILTSNASEFLASNPELLEDGGPATAGSRNDSGVTMTNKECELKGMHVKDSSFSELTTAPAATCAKSSMDQLDDIFADGSVKKARPTGKFQPKAKPKPPNKNSAAASVPSSTVVQASEGAVPPSEAVPVDVANTENIGMASDIPLKDSILTSNAPEFLASNPELLEEGGPVIAGSRNDSGVTMNNKECELEEMHVKDSTFSELTTAPAQRTKVYQPKRKIQAGRKPCVASTKSVSSTSLPPEVNLSEKNFLHEDVVNVLSTGGLTDDGPIVETSEIPVNVESVDLIETTPLDSSGHLEGVPEVPAKLVSRRAKKGKHEAQAASDFSSHQKNACTSSQENETGRSLRPRKRNASFVEHDEAEDAAAINELSDKLPDIPATKDGDDDEQIQQETEPKTKKSRGKKSRKPDKDKEKRAKKQKKDKEVSAQVADVKPKKFSHSTKRRRVDPSLINMDHEYLDMGTLCIRDVIRLGEHWERQKKKEEVAAKPATKPSNANSPAPYNGEDEPFTYGEGEEDNDEQEKPVIEESSLLVNYHTYMDRTPTIRWSKQDTELFYEGVSQFGADLSMIQQLFPSRTRHQIKLKYKKEEKQHPLRLRDALTNRTKNFSHYELLIERLKQMAEEEKQNADKDEPIDLTGEEIAEEGSYHADEEEADENKQFEEEDKEDVAHDIVQESTDPVEEPYDSEEDNLLWSQYKSDI